MINDNQTIIHRIWTIVLLWRGGANVLPELLVKIHIVDKMGRSSAILVMSNSFPSESRPTLRQQALFDSRSVPIKKKYDHKNGISGGWLKSLLKCKGMCYVCQCRCKVTKAGYC